VSELLFLSFKVIIERENKVILGLFPRGKKGSLIKRITYLVHSIQDIFEVNGRCPQAMGSLVPFQQESGW